MEFIMMIIHALINTFKSSKEVLLRKFKAGLLMKTNNHIMIPHPANLKCLPYFISFNNFQLS